VSDDPHLNYESPSEKGEQSRSLYLSKKPRPREDSTSVRSDDQVRLLAEKKSHRRMRGEGKGIRNLYRRGANRAQRAFSSKKELHVQEEKELRA